MLECIKYSFILHFNENYIRKSALNLFLTIERQKILNKPSTLFPKTLVEKTEIKKIGMLYVLDSIFHIFFNTTYLIFI